MTSGLFQAHGISTVDAAANLNRAFGASHGACTSAEFETDPERFIAEWMGGIMTLYVAARTC